MKLYGNLAVVESRLDLFFKKRRVIAIESAGDLLNREILKIVYDCMLSGMTRHQIAIHLEISRDSVDKLRSEIKAQLSTNTTLSKLLQGEKSAV
jgi:FixJ family two-component response regulator